jgi:hypothetical protein
VVTLDCLTCGIRVYSPCRYLGCSRDCCPCIALMSVWPACQLVVGWYFGGSEPKNPPLPILVGGHMGHSYNTCNFKRASVDGSPIQVATVGQPPESIHRFGYGKCQTASTPGRWIFMFDKPCAPPYCTGDRFKTVHRMDWVSPSVCWLEVCGYSC